MKYNYNKSMFDVKTIFCPTKSWCKQIWHNFMSYIFPIRFKFQVDTVSVNEFCKYFVGNA